MTGRPVVLVTGAGRGIGRAAAVALARRGYDLVINERSPADETEASVAAVEAAGGRAAVVHGDIARLDEHAALLDEAWAAFGRVDGVDEVQIDVETKQVTVRHEPSIDRDRIVNVLDQAGFPAT